jgi:hypothetical protein
MAKVKVLGSAAVVVSELKVKDIETLRKFKPSALKLVDKETKDELFAVSMSSTPAFNKFGANFTNANAEGFAEMTITIPTTVAEDQKKTYVADNFGYALLSLNKLEEQALTVLAETAEDFAAIHANIETI